jgi:hypothetical protein
VGGWMDKWMGLKPDLRDCLAQSKTLNFLLQVYNTMFLDIVSIVKTNVENSIDRLGLSGIKILNLVRY